MKKLLFVLSSLAMSGMLLAANYTAKATLAITSEHVTSPIQLKLYEAPEYTADKETMVEAPAFMNPVADNAYVVNFYATCAWGQASKAAENDLTGLKMTFQSNRVDNEYTMTFSNIIGTIHLKDLVTETIITIKEGVAPYVFTQTADNSIIERFEIVEIPAEPAICHQYGNLIITGHQGAKVKVLDMADQVAIAEQTLATDDEVISLSELTSGEMYQVVVDDGEPMLIRIQ